MRALSLSLSLYLLGELQSILQNLVLSPLPLRDTLCFCLSKNPYNVALLTE